MTAAGPSDVLVLAGQLMRIRFQIFGSPGIGSLNRKHTIHYIGRRCPRCKRGTPKIGVSEDAERWKSTAAIVVRQAAVEVPTVGRMMPREVGVAITLYWPRKHRKDPHLEGLPFGDVDACEKLTLDALKAGGVIYDDGQVTLLNLRKRHDAQRPRVAVSAQRIDPRALEMMKR